MPKHYVALFSLGFSLLLSACAQQLPPSMAPAPIPVSSERALLHALDHCGAANSLACAQIHLALAQHYLRQQPLRRTNVAAAHSELQMAAQNSELAKQVEGWRSLSASWLQLSAHSGYPSTCQRSDTPALAAQIEKLTAENAVQNAKLTQLNSLLQSEAKNSLQEKPK